MTGLIDQCCHHTSAYLALARRLVVRVVPCPAAPVKQRLPPLGPASAVGLATMMQRDKDKGLGSRPARFWARRITPLPW
jgi:hypothetical protein